MPYEFDELDEIPSHNNKACWCLGYHVARNLKAVDDPDRRALVWFTHGAAVQVGGFEKLAALIPDYVPDAVGTQSMREIAANPAKKWNEALGRRVANEIDPFLSLGSIFSEPLGNPSTVDLTSWPANYESAVAQCRAEIAGMGSKLREFCLGRSGLSDLVGGTAITLGELLARFREEWRRRSMEQLADTSVSRKVCSALDYAVRAGPGITIIEGDPRTGKTVSAKAWCDAHMDRCRYLSLESSMTDSAFFLDVNAALGNQRLKSAPRNRLRLSIREVLDSRDLLLTIDEGQWLWGNAKTAIPPKINWLMTAVVNRGCSVALVVTPQFLADLGRVERDTAWASAQWKGRIVNLVKLPTTLPTDEICRVARKIVPSGDSEAIRALAAFAAASPSYLQAIRAAVSRAEFLASESGAKLGTAHVKAAIGEQLNLVQDLAKSVDAGKGRRRPGLEKSSPLSAPRHPAESISEPASADRLQPRFSGPAKRVQSASEALVSTT